MNKYIPYSLLVLFSFAKEQLCELNVTLKADSWEVKFRDEVTLYCYYDLEGSSLLSVKWYRGEREFFRYDPILTPHWKTFPIGNTKINLNRSNETQVTLQEIGYEFNGQIKCEVTLDYIYTAKEAIEHLSVVWLPRNDPVITTNKDKYVVNETLLANCTSSLSHPALSLSFLLNNEPVDTSVSKHIACNRSEQGFQTVLCENDDNTTYWTWLPLNITLESKYFNNHTLHLHCIAVLNTYKRSTYMLIPLISEAKPEKVASDGSSSQNDRMINYHVITLAILWIRSR